MKNLENNTQNKNNDIILKFGLPLFSILAIIYLIKACLHYKELSYQDIPTLFGSVFGIFITMIYYATKYRYREQAKEKAEINNQKNKLSEEYNIIKDINQALHRQIDLKDKKLAGISPKNIKGATDEFYFKLFESSLDKWDIINKSNKETIKELAEIRPKRRKYEADGFIFFFDEGKFYMHTPKITAETDPSKTEYKVISYKTLENKISLYRKDKREKLSQSSLG